MNEHGKGKKTLETVQFAELAMFIYTSIDMYQEYGLELTWSGPVPYCSVLIYNPRRRWEAWRYISYM